MFKRHVLICAAEPLAKDLRAIIDDVEVLCSLASPVFDEPTVMIYPDNVWYRGVDVPLMERIVESHLKHNRPIEDAIFHHTTPKAEPQRNSTKRGLVLVNTGYGKGKSTAAFGVILRMLGRKKRVALIQFLKHESGQWGEIRALAELGLDAVKTGDGWTWKSKDMDETQSRALHGWEIAKQKIISNEFDLVVMDEFTYLMAFGWLDAVEVVEWLKVNKPEGLNLIITGRDAPQVLVDYADTVTNMTKVKHAYDIGITARAGIEF